MLFFPRQSISFRSLSLTAPFLVLKEPPLHPPVQAIKNHANTPCGPTSERLPLKSSVSRSGAAFEVVMVFAFLLRGKMARNGPPER